MFVSATRVECSVTLIRFVFAWLFTVTYRCCCCYSPCSYYALPLEVCLILSIGCYCGLVLWSSDAYDKFKVCNIMHFVYCILLRSVHHSRSTFIACIITSSVHRNKLSTGISALKLTRAKARRVIQRSILLLLLLLLLFNSIAIDLTMVVSPF